MSDVEPFKVDLEICPIPLMVVGSDGCIRKTNRRLTLLFGYATGELIGQSVEVLVPPAVRPDHPRLRDSFFANPSSRQMGTGRDLHGMRKDGTTLPVEVGLEPIRFDDEPMVMVSVVDITERKRDLMLRQSQFTMDNVSEAVFWIREDGSFSYVNKQASQYLGYSHDELCQMTVSDINPEYPIESWPHHWDETKDKGVLEFESFHQRKDGSRYDCRITKHFLTFEDEDFIFATVRDITADKAAQKRLRVTQEALDTAADAVVWVAPDGNILYANKVMCERLQYSESELTSMNIADVNPDLESAEQFADVFWPKIEQQKSSVFRLRHQRRDGSTFPVEIATHFIEFEDERFACSIVRDLTESVALQSELVRGRFFLDNSQDATYWVTEFGDFVYANKAATRMLGYSKEQLLQMRVGDIDPSYPPELWKAWWEQMRGDRFALVSTTHTDDEGNARHVEVAAHFIEYEGVEYIVGVTRDITEQTKAEQAQRAIAAQFESIVESLPVAVIYVDAERRIKRVNPAFEKLFGYSAKEAADRQTKFFYADPDDFGVAGRKRFNPDAKKTNEPYEVRYRRKDGSEFIGETIGTPIANSEDETFAYLGLVTDITDRKQTQQQLVQAKTAAEESEQRFKSMLRVLPDAYYVFDFNVGTAIFENRPLRDQGVADPEYHDGGLPILSFAHPDDRQALIDHAARLQTSADGEIVEVRYRLRQKDGSYRSFLARDTPYRRDEDGKVQQIIGTATDVTGLQQYISEIQTLQQTVKESADRYSWAMRNANIGLWYWEPDTDNVTFSDTAKTQLGYSPTEDWNSFAEWETRLHPDDREKALAAAQALTESPDQAYESVFRLRTKSGEYRWIRSVGKGIFDEDGNLERLIGVHIDIHDVQQAMYVAAESEARFRALANSAPPLAWTTEPDGGCSWLNQRWLDYSGRSLESQIGMGWIDCVHPDDRERIWASANVAIERREPFSFEYRLRRHDGQYRWFMVSATPRFNTKNEFVGYVGMSFDNHDVHNSRMALEASALRLQQTNAQLKKSNADLEQFAYIASHDLRQPLVGINRLTQWIVEDSGDALPESSKQHLQTLQGRVSRLDALLDDLLSYSRAGRTSAKFDLVDLNQLIDYIVDTSDTGTDFEIRKCLEVNKLTASKTLLETVLRNLIGNAFKHGPSTGCEVDIVSVDSPNWVTFKISDNGPGVPAKYHARIFQMFQTLKPRDEVEGSGIGLAIVRKIVTAHGGHISVQSEEGRGTTFTFTWPKRHVNSPTNATAETNQ